jgi:hypothetical protein
MAGIAIKLATKLSAKMVDFQNLSCSLRSDTVCYLWLLVYDFVDSMHIYIEGIGISIKWQHLLDPHPSF